MDTNAEINLKNELEKNEEGNIGIKAIDDFKNKKILKIFCLFSICVSLIITILNVVTNISNFNYTKINLSFIAFIIMLILLVLGTFCELNTYIKGLGLIKADSSEYLTILKSIQEMIDLRVSILVLYYLVYLIFFEAGGIIGLFVNIFTFNIETIIKYIVPIVVLMFFESIVKDVIYVIKNDFPRFRFETKFLLVVYIINFVYYGYVSFKIITILLSDFNLLYAVIFIYAISSGLKILFVTEIEKTVKKIAFNK